MTESFLERVWAQREEEIYPKIFGDLGDGIFTLGIEMFTNVFKQSPDPRWLTIGVFESPPSQMHAHWAYVSSGLSNPWDDDAPDLT